MTFYSWFVFAFYLLAIVIFFKSIISKVRDDS